MRNPAHEPTTSPPSPARAPSPRTLAPHACPRGPTLLVVTLPAPCLLVGRRRRAARPRDGHSLTAVRGPSPAPSPPLPPPLSPLGAPYRHPRTRSPERVGPPPPPLQPRPPRSRCGSCGARPGICLRHAAWRSTRRSKDPRRRPLRHTHSPPLSHHLLHSLCVPLHPAPPAHRCNFGGSDRFRSDQRWLVCS